MNISKESKKIIRIIAVIAVHCLATAAFVIAVVLLFQNTQINDDIAELKNQIAQYQVQEIPEFTLSQPLLKYSTYDQTKDSFNGDVQITCSDNCTDYVVMVKVKLSFNGVEAKFNQGFFFGGVVNGVGSFRIDGSGEKGTLTNPECEYEIIGYIPVKDLKK